MRVFAGPNGSGKSSLFYSLFDSGKFNTNYFLNADNIEKELREKRFIHLSAFGLKSETSSFTNYLASSSLKVKAEIDGFQFNLSLVNNLIVSQSKEVNSYEAAFVAAFLRQELVKTGQSFAFETVMSHESKLQEIQLANGANYQTYLYYISTESSLINKERVAMRVEKGGHPVDQEKIHSRYKDSLELLYDAVQLVHRAYLFDNSGREYRLVSEFYKGKMAEANYKNLPHWFQKHIIQKILF